MPEETSELRTLGQLTANSRETRLKVLLLALTVSNVEHMFERSTVRLLEEGTDVAFFDDHSDEALDGELQVLKRCRARLDAVEANVLRAANLRETSPRKRTSSQDERLARTGASRRDSRQSARRAELFDRLPAVSEFLAEGQILSGHADLLTGIPSKYAQALESDVANLLTAAQRESVDEFAETVRRWRSEQARRDGDDHHKQLRDQRSASFRRDRASGITIFNARLDPESAAHVRASLIAIERRMQRADQQTATDDPDFEPRSLPQRLADAFVESARLAAGADPAAARRVTPTVIVGINLSDLLGGEGEGEAYGTGAISAETARKLACEGGVIPAVFDSNGVLLDMGRRTRLATESQRLALLARYGGCAVPGCDAAFEWCHMHHIAWWEGGGLTDLNNLIPVCARHHTDVHDGRLVIERDDAGVDQWKRRTGAARGALSRSSEEVSCWQSDRRTSSRTGRSQRRARPGEQWSRRDTAQQTGVHR